MSDTAIKVEDLGKLYKLGEITTGTISHDLKRWWASIRGKEDPYAKIGAINDCTSKGTDDYVWALKDINFEIKKGEAVGIIGRNGAGKSTLLKLLSKVTAPTKGSIKLNGRLASLLEVGTGFHPELTGRENIFLNGAILGMTRAEIRRKFDEIVDFAGVEKYIDTPVKRYSSGMYVRLAFAVAAHLESEILIVDEVLAVGDTEFQKKCLGKMGEVSKGEGRTVLFVSHDLNAVTQLCTKGLLISQGTIEFKGNVPNLITRYLTSNIEPSVYTCDQPRTNKKMFIKKIEVIDEYGKIKSDFLYNETVRIKFTIEINERVEEAGLFVTILDSRKRRVFSCETETLQNNQVLTILPEYLVRGSYSLHAFINWPKVEQIDVAEDVCNFKIFDSGSYLAKHGAYDYGSVFGKYSWINQ